MSDPGNIDFGDDSTELPKVKEAIKQLSNAELAAGKLSEVLEEFQKNTKLSGTSLEKVNTGLRQYVDIISQSSTAVIKLNKLQELQKVLQERQAAVQKEATKRGEGIPEADLKANTAANEGLKAAILAAKKEVILGARGKIGSVMGDFGLQHPALAAFGKSATGPAVQLLQGLAPLIEGVTGLSGLIKVAEVFGTLLPALSAMGTIFSIINAAAGAAYKNAQNFNTGLGLVDGSLSKLALTTWHYGILNNQLQTAVLGSAFSAKEAYNAYNSLVENYGQTSADVLRTMGPGKVTSDQFAAAQERVSGQTSATIVELLKLTSALGLSDAQAGKLGAELRTKFLITDQGTMTNVIKNATYAAQNLGIHFTDFTDIMFNMGAATNKLGLPTTLISNQFDLLAASMIDTVSSARGLDRAVWESGANMKDVMSGIATFAEGITPEQYLGFKGITPGKNTGEQLFDAIKLSPLQRMVPVLEQYTRIAGGELGSKRNLGWLTTILQQNAGVRDTNLAFGMAQVFTANNGELIRALQGGGSGAEALAKAATKLSPDIVKHMEDLGQTTHAAQDLQGMLAHKVMDFMVWMQTAWWLSKPTAGLPGWLGGSKTNTTNDLSSLTNLRGTRPGIGHSVR